MGGLSSLFGKPKKQKYKATADEKAQANAAFDDYKRLSSTFYPLQDRAVAESRLSHTELLKRRANADAMQGSTPVLNSGRQLSLATGFGPSSGNVVMGTADAVTGTTDALAAGAIGARFTNQQVQDQQKKGLVGLGHGLAKDTNAGIAMSAKVANSNQLSHLENNRLRRQANLEAIMSVAGTAASMGMASYLGGGANSSNPMNTAELGARERSLLTNSAYVSRL